MRILAFNYEYPPLGGGGGVAFKRIAEALAQRHHVTVITSLFRGLERYESRGNLRIVRVPVLMRRTRCTASMPSLVSYWPSSWLEGRRLLRREPFDVINSHFAVPSSPAAHQLARRFGLPHVLSMHGGDIFDPSKLTSPHWLPGIRPLVRHLLKSADRLVAQSRNTADNARRLYGVDRAIDLIPLGITPGRVSRMPRGQLGIEPDRFVIATVGRLVARKRLEDLLHILAAMNDPRDLLLVIGDGPKCAEWQALAHQLGVADRVRFTGYVDDNERNTLLAAADLFASTSQHEGFGLVFLEAMDQGLPIIAYDHGGQSDFLQDGRTGALVPFGWRDRFIVALQQLKQSPELRRRCAQFNRQRVRDFYIDRCARLYENLFQELAASVVDSHSTAVDCGVESDTSAVAEQ